MLDTGSLIVGLVLLAAAAAMVRYLRPRLTVASVFATVWGVLLLIQGLVSPITQGIPGPVLVAVASGALATIVGTASVQVFRLRQGVTVPRAPLMIGHQALRMLTAGHFVLSAMLLGYVVAQILAMAPYVEQAGGFLALLTPGSGAARELKGALAANANSGEPFGGSIGAGILSYGLYMGNASLFTGGVLGALGRRWIALIPLALNAAFSLVTFQRTSFIVAVLLIVGTWIIARPLVSRPDELERDVEGQPRKRLPRRRILAWAGGAVAGAIVLLVPIQLRNSSTGDSAGLLSLGQYAFGSIAGFGARLSSTGEFIAPLLNGVPAITPGFGAYTFTKGLGVLSKLGFPVTEVPYTYDYYSTEIFGRDFSTNTATLLYDFILDGGMWWLVSFLVLFAAAATWLQTAPRVSVRLVSLPLVAFALATIAWSFFVGTLLRDSRNILVALVAALLLSVWLRTDSARQRKVNASG